jgi:hypothetical protein
MRALGALLMAAFFAMVWSTGPEDGVAIGAGLVALHAHRLRPGHAERRALHAAVFAVVERRRRGRGSFGAGLQR